MGEGDWICHFLLDSIFGSEVIFCYMFLSIKTAKTRLINATWASSGLGSLKLLSSLEYLDI